MHSTARVTDSGILSGNSVLVGLLIVLDSMHFVFARLLLPHISPSVSVLFVLGVSTFEVGLFGWLRGGLRLREIHGRFWFFLTVGLLIALSIMINYQAVAFIDPGTASLLSQTSVLFGLGFGVGWMHDRFSLRQLAGVALTICGVFIISFQKGDYLRLGSLLVVSSSLAYALHAALAKHYADQMDFLTFFFGRLLFTTVLLFLVAAGRGVLTWPTSNAWGLLILVGTIDIVLSRALYYLALCRLTMSVHTLVLRLSPVATVLWSYLLFGAVPSLQQSLGGLAVIVGVILATLRPASQKAAPE